MKKIIKLLAIHGATNAQAAFDELLAAGLVSEEATTRNTAVLLISITAPADVNLLTYTIDRIGATNENGFTFGATLKNLLGTDPAQIDVSQIAICQNQPFARISFFENESMEFESPGNKCLGIRTECIFSGSLILLLATRPYKLER